MKKLILCALALATTVGVMAQSNRQTPREALSKSSKFSKIAAEPASITSAPLQRNHSNGTPSNQAVGVTTLGSAGNAFTVAFNSKTPLFAHPAINTIAFFHRNNAGTFGGTSGQIRYDLSTDGGATWTSDNGPIYDAAGGAVAPFANARYPQGTIYNPIGNTTASNAYLSFFAPTLAVQGGGLCGSASSWGGFAHGSAPLSGGTTVQSEDLSFNYLIPDASALNTVNNEHWVLSTGTDIGGDVAATCDYLDYIIVGKGTWNATTFTYDYTYSNLPAPVELGDGTTGKLMNQTRIAWGVDGTTGYITFIGHESFVDQADSTRYPVVFKTTDAGASWNRVASIDFQAIDAATALDGVTTLGFGTTVTIGFDHNLTVDANGNLHIVTEIMPLATNYNSFFNIPVGIVDIYTTNGGSTWVGQLLGVTMSFSGTYNDGSGVATLQEYNRCQTTRSIDGTHLFFTYFDTDTTLTTPSTENVFPDAYIYGYNTTTGLWTNKILGTAGSAADATMNFGEVAPIALNGASAGCYNIPMTNAEILTNVSAAVNFRYISGVDVCDADFTVTGVPTPLTNSVGVKELTGNDKVVIGNNYPNPFNGITNLDINLKSKSNVTIEVSNILGKSVKTINAGVLNAGVNTVKIDASGLSAGMYTYTVSVGAEKLSGKMMVK